MSDGKKCAADDTRIAGEKKISDWKKFRENLLPDKKFNEEDWEKAFDGYFMERLETRYFRPIRQIEKMNENKGEGFAIVTLCCSLMEFIETTIEGEKAKDRFDSFLTKREPFKNYVTEGNTKNFFRDVRCALLHSAKTDGDWKVLSSKSHKSIGATAQSINFDNTTIYKDKILDDIQLCIQQYKSDLLSNLDQTLNRKFIEKMDRIFS